MALTKMTIQRIFSLEGKDGLPEVLGSRLGLGKLVVSKKSINSYIGTAYLVEMHFEYDPDLMQPGDYVVIRQGLFQKTILGKALPNFGTLWPKWVNNSLIQVSAVNHIVR